MLRCFSPHRILILTGLLLCTVTLGDDAKNSDQREDRRDEAKISTQVLNPFNTLVGSWRGLGQLKRGSRQGAWLEKVVCEWDFKDGTTAIVLAAEDGRQFTTLRLAGDPLTAELVLQQTHEGKVREYRGKVPKQWPDRLELVSAADADGVVWRCTIQQLNEIRCTLLFEKQTTPRGSFRRVAEIGYTRSGERLAVVGGNQRKCIVTGGLGTIPVTWKGQTWYVCCQGCVQAFNDDPEGIIAEYKASLKSTSK